MSRESLATLLKMIIQVVLYLLLVNGFLALLVMNNQSIAFPILEWAGVAALGVAAGLMARWRLRTHTLALKFLTAVLALVVNLWILGLLTAGSLGFSVSAISTSGVNWRGLGQLGLGALLVWISLATKRETVQASKPEKRQAKGSSQPAIKKGKSRKQDKKGVVKPGKPKPGHASKSSSAWPESVKRFSDSIKVRVDALYQNYLQPVGRAIHNTQKETVRQLKSNLTRLKPSEPQAGLTVGTKINRKSQKSVVRVGRTPLKVQPVVSGNKSSEIRLLGAIEHRCPFCLEIVEKNDPRGVKICKICHTYHHADCWDVTGTCQVPHHHG